MTYTNGEVLDIFNDLQAIINRSDKMPVKFSYALMVNYRRIQTIAQNIQAEIDRHTPEFQIITAAMQNLRKDFALIQNGNMAMAPDGFPFVSPSKIFEYDQVCKELIKQTDGWTEIHDHRISVIRELRSLPCDEFKPYTIASENLPAEITPSDVVKISFMLTMPDELDSAQPEAAS